MLEMLLGKKKSAEGPIILNMWGDSFTDTSPFGHPIIVTNNPTIDTSITKFGGGSLKFNTGSGTDRLSIADTPDLRLGSGNFTIEGLIYTRRESLGPVYYDHILGKGNGNQSNTWALGLLSTKLYFGFPGGNVADPVALPILTWVSFAVVRELNVVRLYKNGSKVAEGSVSINFSTTESFNIGDRKAGDPSLQYPFSGNLEQIRITKGIAKYTSDYTPVALT